MGVPLKDVEDINHFHTTHFALSIPKNSRMDDYKKKTKKKTVGEYLY